MASMIKKWKKFGTRTLEHQAKLINWARRTFDRQPKTADTDGLGTGFNEDIVEGAGAGSFPLNPFILGLPWLVKPPSHELVYRSLLSTEPPTIQEPELAEFLNLSKIQKLRFIQKDTEAALDETMEIVKTKKRAKRRREAEKDSDEEKMEVEKGPSCFLQEVDKWTW
ncbi:Hypothetical protein SMAX5B_011244 [Scophthalmus maximus]|uniref:Uncharacterized protein n=1 Tax=Scophthalmus maximus TaxID=52904 RepID=A0A2U9BHT4_SCOMX|nr:Hypothetical protein SMAX5B_011244 [Scophthalmus maximus]